MSLPPPKQFIQDMPPVGGFVRPPGFPAEAFRKRSPARGPGGVVMMAGAAALTMYGMYSFLGDAEERNYMSLARFNAKFERAYVEQAREEVQWERRQKECLDGERELMKGVKGWVVGARRYHTQWEDKPDKDVLDPRRIGPW